MVVAWVITIPAAAVVGALLWELAHLLGGALLGAAAVVVVLAAAAAVILHRSRQAPVHADNVNNEWADGGASTSAPSDRTPASA